LKVYRRDKKKMKEKKRIETKFEKIKKIRLNDKIENKSTIYKRVRDKNYKSKK
jgi:hypothetical protein